MKRRLRHPPRTAGFTMVEVLVVMMIIGILALIAAPSWGGIAASRRAGVAQDQILQKLREAQADAIRTRQPRTVSFNTTATPPTIQVSTQTTPPVVSQTILGEEATQTAISPTLLALRVSGSTDTPNNEVVFDDRGTVTRGVGMIVTAVSPANNGRQRCVIVETLLGALRSGRDQECGS